MNKQAKHTPGHWFVGSQNDALYIIDRRPAHDNDCPNHDADREAIARIYDDVRGVEGSGRANARLIAAAPELLELLIESQQSIGVDWRSRRDALIAKAVAA